VAPDVTGHREPGFSSTSTIARFVTIARFAEAAASADCRA
jgi:hypothetical protein